MKNILLYLSLLILYLPVFSQNAEIDSLENLLANHQKTDTIKIDLLNDIAFKMRFYDLDRTLQYARLADSLSDITSYKKGKAKSLKIQGVYFKSTEDYPKALNCYQESIKISREINDRLTMAACYNNIGNIYKSQGNYPHALEKYQQTLSLFEELGKKHYVAIIQLNVAVLYGYMGKRNEELAYYFKVADYFNEIQDYRTLITVYQNIVSAYINTANDSLALHYTKKLIPLCKSMGDTEKLTLALINYGVIEDRFGNNDSAEQKYHEAISVSEKANFERGSFSAYYALASYYYKRGVYNLALQNAHKSYERVDKTSRLREKSETAELLSLIYEETNNFKEAYKYHVVFKSISDSIYNESNIKEITTLENRYQFDKEKEALAAEQAKKDALQEAEFLRQKTVRNSFIIGFILMIVFVLIIFRNLTHIRKANRKLIHQNEEIETQKEEIESQAEKIGEQYAHLEKLDRFKESLTHALVHDLKNPLSQVLINTSNRNVRNAAGKMLRLINNMLDVEKYETAEFRLNKEQHSLRDMLEGVINGQEISLREKNLELHVHFTDYVIVTDIDVMIRVFDNLLSNAIRHSPLNSSIDVKAEPAGGDKLKISISNYGDPIPDEALPYIFDKYRHFGKTRGGALQSTGLGLTFCKMAIEAHGEKIGVSSNAEDGTDFWFTLPYAPKNGETGENTVCNLNDEMLFSDTDFEIVKSIVKKVIEFELYEISRYREVLDPLKKASGGAVGEWISRLFNAINMQNKDEYKRLINLAEYEQTKNTDR